MSEIHFGTCSWKYDSWKGIVYPEQGKPTNHLEAYADHFDSVEVDQWFWSLFGVDKVKLPDSKTVNEYLDAVHGDFQFTIKVPNSITLSHFYTHGKPKNAPLEANPHFFSVELFKQFLERIEPLRERVGVLMFQFEYLNRRKMASQGEFLQRLGEFIGSCPGDYKYAMETRIPNYLNEGYFEFLKRYGLSHIFVQGYYMPPIMDVFRKFREMLGDMVVIRLMGSDRKGIELRAGNKWGKIVDSRDDELPDIVVLIRELESRGIKVFVNVNNHYEGSAPLTIKKIQEMLQNNQ
ncbi:MAG: DUF72 domain-containing protein [bacterium]|nr:DUF72 domain-containing protein [bacterium]